MRKHLVVAGALAAVLTTPLVAHADDVDGSSGPDNLKGTADADTITAYGGDDVARGLAGGDLVFGGRGDDRLLGGKGRDELRGGEGADVLDGGHQWDALVGNDGADRLFGRGAGVWFGNMGDDRITIAYPDGAETRVRCGGGDDVLIFNEPYDDVSIKGCETVKVISAG
jgi:Ca2+-binding RTX toxin-like protein